MKTLFLNMAAVLGCSISLMACASDPLVGTWEGTEDDRVDLDVEAVDDRYEGEGHIYLCNDTQCFLCGFDFEAEESGDDRWDISGKFTGDCSEAGDFDGVECELKRDGEELECDIADGVTITYEKKE
jgi:hypothetical protein